MKNPFGEAVCFLLDKIARFESDPNVAEQAKIHSIAVRKFSEDIEKRASVYAKSPAVFTPAPVPQPSIFVPPAPAAPTVTGTGPVPIAQPPQTTGGAPMPTVTVTTS